MKRLSLNLFSWSTRTYLIVVVVLGTVARFIDIAESSIWHDEGFTMMLTQMAPAQIIARTARDVHPPLYYLLLHYWIMVFGSSETGARSLSAAFLIAAIPVAYLLVRRLWDERAARLAGLFVAMGPFLVRYSQEARMYGMVAFLLLLATYLLVRALDDPRNAWWWSGYALAMAAAFYTHYYAVFMVAVHWIYVAVRTRRSGQQGVWNWRWWAANFGIVALFLPWLPTAYHQYTRVQASFWIPRATLTTLPSTLIEFIVYGINTQVGRGVTLALGVGLVALIVWLFWRRPSKRSALTLIGCYALLAPVVVWLISFGSRPIFVDRYFVFAAVAFYSLIGVLVAQLRGRWVAIATALMLALFTVGIISVHVSTDHQMRVIGKYVSTHYRPGDEILSGELYTFFDFSYYNHSGATVHLWSSNGVNGYNESSLIYDRANQIVVEKLSTVHPLSGYLWMVGKTGYHEYFDPKILPKNWTPVGPKITAGYCAVQEYHIN